MQRNKTRDIVLLVFVGLLVVVAMLPDDDENAIESSGADLLTADASVDEKENEPTGAAAPAVDQFHPYFPLIPGSTWVYRVAGSPDFVPDKVWTMSVVSAPHDDNPGVIEVGYGKERTKANVWRDGDGIRTDGMPLIEPGLFLNDIPTKIEGLLLPLAAGIIPNGIWKEVLTREVTHKFRDKKGEMHEEIAVGKQQNRAFVQVLDSVSVPAGRFEGYRISWLSRIELNAHGRPVLKELTAEPFRRELMWVVKGIGIVRREIDYSSRSTKLITFDLLRYDRPIEKNAPSADAGR
jgi:hypothetical protein